MIQDDLGAGSLARRITARAVPGRIHDEIDSLENGSAAP